MAHRAPCRPIGILSALVFAMILGPVERELAAQADGQKTDLYFARQLLAGARGTSPLICEMALRTMDSRFGSWNGYNHTSDAGAEQRDIVDWTSNAIASADAVPILSVALSDGDRCVRRFAARLLGRVRHSEALVALLDRLGNGDDRTQEMAAMALGFSENRDAVEGLIRSLTDDAATVRAAAAWALGQIEDERAIDALSLVLKQDPDASVRAQAARALGEIG